MLSPVRNKHQVLKLGDDSVDMRGFQEANSGQTNPLPGDFKGAPEVNQ